MNFVILIFQIICKNISLTDRPLCKRPAHPDVPEYLQKMSYQRQRYDLATNISCMQFLQLLMAIEVWRSEDFRDWLACGSSQPLLCQHLSTWSTSTESLWPNDAYFEPADSSYCPVHIGDNSVGKVFESKIAYSFDSSMNDGSNRGCDLRIRCPLKMLG